MKKNLAVLFFALLLASDANASKWVKDYEASLASRPALSQVPEKLGGKWKRTTEDAYWQQMQKVQRQECLADESDFLTIQKSVLHPFILAWKKSDVAALTGLMGAQAKLTGLPGIVEQGGEEIGQIRRKETLSETVKSAKPEISAALAAYFQNFSSLEDFELHVVQVASANKDRFSDLSLKRAVLSAKFDARGIEGQNMRRADRGGMQIELSRSGKGKPWVIEAITVGKVETTRSAAPSFVAATEKFGLNKLPVYQRLEAIRRGGFGLAVADYNNDKIPDLYYGAYGDGVLLKGNASGQFEVDASAGVAAHSRVKSALFADFDNDGNEDLLLIRFAGQVDANDKTRTNKGEEIVLYKNLGDGKFVQTKSISKEFKSRYAMPATMADFNKDGLLDFYVGFPGVKDFTSSVFDMPAKDVAVQGLFWNKGDLQLAMAPIEQPGHEATKERSANQMLYPHSALAADYDLDGDMDILVVDDRGNISPAYQNDGSGTFRQSNQDIQVANQGYGMGVTATDYNNDGVMDLLFSNVTTLASMRITESCQQNWGYTFPAKQNVKSLRLYRGLGNGKFAEATEEAGLTWAGEGLAGVEFTDYNSDGFQDIAVTNGLWSGTDSSELMGSIFFARTNGRVQQTEIDETSDGTVSAVMKALAAPGKTTASLAGNQHKRLFRNLGNGKFLEVGHVENFTSKADGYVIAKTDLNRDGKVDLVLRNGDPGTKSVNFSPVEVFENQNAEGNFAVRLELKGGEKSNRNAIGSIVKVRTGKTWQVQQVLGANGTVQSEKALVFGLGKATRADEVLVRWPSGKQTTHTGIKSGIYYLDEDSAKIQLGAR